jgi:hypothetical protein
MREGTLGVRRGMESALLHWRAARVEVAARSSRQRSVTPWSGGGRIAVARAGSVGLQLPRGIMSELLLDAAGRRRSPATLIEIPQVREAAQTFASKLFPRTPKLLRTEPLKALVIGAFVRGLSMRDVESLCEQAGLGKLSKSTASRICEELRERYAAFTRRSLYEVQLVALFLDATFISVRPSGPKEGVLVAWGFTADGERVLLSVMLGMRESSEDWEALARDPRQIPRTPSRDPRGDDRRID